MVQPVLPKGNATRTEDRESGNGAPLGDSFVRDVGVRNEITSGEESVRTQESPEQAMVCSRTPSNGLGILLPFTGESALVIMIGVATEETNGSDRVLDPKRLRCEPGVGAAHLQLERNGALVRVHGEVCSKLA